MYRSSYRLSEAGSQRSLCSSLALFLFFGLAIHPNFSEAKSFRVSASSQKEESKCLLSVALRRLISTRESPAFDGMFNRLTQGGLDSTSIYHHGPSHFHVLLLPALCM